MDLLPKGHPALEVLELHLISSRSTYHPSSNMLLWGHQFSNALAYS